MNGYELATPRAALGLTAVAMAAIAIGALVLLSATAESMGADWYTLAAANAEPKAPVAVAISPPCTDVPRDGRS